jgi:peptidoglycan hydrolase-like protein with peptidoglycan-binding domain
MSWRVAECLQTLLQQINEQSPKRSKSSDGSIGDAAHAATTSDHNPWVRDASGVGVVTARDFTHDPAGGCDCQALVDGLIASRDPRIKYVIWNRQIINCNTWVWRPYKGTNPHDHHAHVSVRIDPALYDSKVPWRFELPEPRGPATPEPPPTLREGSKGAHVVQLQALLKLGQDGIFGPRTKKAVQQFQQMHNLFPDGVVGTYTWKALLR